MENEQHYLKTAQTKSTKIPIKPIIMNEVDTFLNISQLC